MDGISAAWHALVLVASVAMLIAFFWRLLRGKVSLRRFDREWWW